jgi:hypothetical protein
MFGISFYTIAVYVLAGCASTTTTMSSSPGKYSEDLTSLRPKVPPVKQDTVIASSSDTRRPSAYVEPKFAVNDKLNTVLDSIDRFNLSRKYVEGFTIQVYSGKREEALNTKKQLASIAPDVISEIQFTEPIFRVKAGKYYSRIDAQKDYASIKRYFPAAIIIPEKININ